MSEKCGGIHCPGCGDGGSGIITGVICLIVVAVLVNARHAIASGIGTAVHIIFLTVLGIGGLAVGAIAGKIGHMIYRRKHPRMLPESSERVLLVTPDQWDALYSRGDLDAIEPHHAPQVIRLAPSQAKVIKRHGRDVS